MTASPRFERLLLLAWAYCRLIPWWPPVAALISDPDGGVRLQVLISLSERPALLSEEAMLPMLYDPNPYIPGMVEQILKLRGLSPEATRVEQIDRESATGDADVGDSVLEGSARH